MKATISIEYRPLKAHERTGGPDRPWVGETLVQPIYAHDRTGTCRGATFVDALNMCVAGLVEHYQEQAACEKDLDLDDAETAALIERAGEPGPGPCDARDLPESGGTGLEGTAYDPELPATTPVDEPED